VTAIFLVPEALRLSLLLPAHRFSFTALAALAETHASIQSENLKSDNNGDLGIGIGYESMK
jgi:hypothetical protein